MRVANADQVTLRWTIGDVRLRGFEMLRLSIAGAFRLFGSDARYVVCVNSVALGDARERTGALPCEVEWRPVIRAELAQILHAYLDGSLIEGMGWKLVPLRIDPQRYELALDNDCILWELPDGMRLWLESAGGNLLAEDVSRCLGSFDALCAPGALNAGIRGLAPGNDLEESLRSVLGEMKNADGEAMQMVAEIEEQGLQAAAVSRMGSLFLVRNDEVTICSPFWPRSPELGTCGAHFVGMNAAHLAWDYYDRPADAWLSDHWERHRPALYERVGLPFHREAGPEMDL